MEPLAAKKLLVIRVIEMLDGTIPPRLSNGNKDWLNVKMKTQPNHNTEGPWVPVAAAKAQLVIDL